MHADLSFVNDQSNGTDTDVDIIFQLILNAPQNIVTLLMMKTNNTVGCST